MKFMIFVKANPSLEQQVETMSEAAFKESMAKMNAFNEELKKAGVLKDCDGLRPTREAKRVRFDGESRRVIDGPFDGDLVAGYWLWELPSIEEAIAWVKRCPNPMPVPSEIEIRPI
ncbi:MAG TPA: YciI family protein [Steroidobacteraceae bacterium]|nr:YciI family protein [Steroidobacteraceae bacterium]